MTKSNPRILHVEDDPELSNYIALILKGKGKIVKARTLDEANRILNHDHIDLILLDLTLPDGSGMELIRQLETNDAPPIVIFSAHDVTDNLIGADYFFVKGHFLESDLIEAVDILLRKTAAVH